MDIDQMKLLIKEGNIGDVQAFLKAGYDPNSQDVTGNPILSFAFAMKQYDIARLLIEYGAELNHKDDPAIVCACRLDRAFFEFLVQHGADINAINHVGDSALSGAISSNNNEGARALIELGIDLKRVGGDALREAAWSGNEEMVHLLVEKGADIEYCEPNQVFTDSRTPLQAAASKDHFNIVNYLIDHGANILFTDAFGYRAYHTAKFNGHYELAEWIKSIEPEEYHDYNVKMSELTAAGLPAEVLDTLGATNSRIEFEGQCCEYLVFRNIFDVTHFNYYGYEVYDLLLELDNFEATGVVTWCPSRQQFVSVDVEHELVMILHDMTWESFLSEPGRYLDQIVEWGYEPEDLGLNDEDEYEEDSA